MTETPLDGEKIKSLSPTTFKDDSQFALARKCAHHFVRIWDKGFGRLPTSEREKIIVLAFELTMLFFSSVKVTKVKSPPPRYRPQSGLMNVDRSNGSQQVTANQRDGTGVSNQKSAQQPGIIIRRTAGFTQVFTPPKC
jgi:hypothetical protein